MNAAAQKEADAVAAFQAGRAFEKAGDLARAIGKYEEVLASGVNVLNLYPRVFMLKGFTANAPVESNRALFYREVLPAMKQAVDSGHYDQALELESLVYDQFVKQVETEEHYQSCFREWTPILEQAGMHLRSMLPPMEEPSHEASPVQMGFFFHNASLLAHSEVLLGYLEGLRDLEHPPIVPSIYVMSTHDNKHNPDFDRRFSAAGASVHYLYDHTAQGKRLRADRLGAARLRTPTGFRQLPGSRCLPILHSPAPWVLRRCISGGRCDSIRTHSHMWMGASAAAHYLH